MKRKENFQGENDYSYDDYLVDDYYDSIIPSKNLEKIKSNKKNKVRKMKD